MKRLIAISAVFLLFTTFSFAQGGRYFCTELGSVATFEVSDGNGALLAKYSEKVASGEGDYTNGAVHYLHSYYDADGKALWKEGPNMKMDITVTDGECSVRLESVKKAVKASEYMCQGNGFYVPADIKAGQAIKDAKFSVHVGGTIKGTITLSGRKVVAKENVSVPAGSFSAYKVTETQTTKIVGAPTVVKVVTWYVFEKGVVRQEVYDKNGKLLNTIVLTSFK